MKSMLLGRISRYRVFLQQGLAIPDQIGEHLQNLNFDFDYCANEFLENFESLELNPEANQVETDLLRSKLHSQSKEDQMLIDNVKLTDQDLEALLTDLGRSTVFKGEINLGGNNLTDQSVIRIASLLLDNVQLTKISFRKSPKLTFIGISQLAQVLKANTSVKGIDFTDCQIGDLGVNSLIENIIHNQTIQEYNFGLITDKALLYLGEALRREHHVQHLSFQEDPTEVWKESTKENFLSVMRNNNFCKQILSVSINISRIQENSNFIGQLEIFCNNNRQGYLYQKQNEFKVKELDTEHPEYFDPDDFKQNAFKFSVKTYLANVFESLLDEGLFYLEKERQNVLRDEEIQKVTNEITQQSNDEDICTSNGSLIVLARYLIQKTKR